MSNSEAIILKILWELNKPTSISEIILQLQNRNIEWAYTTVSTFLNRMKKKNLVDIIQQGKIYYYYTIVKEDDVINEAKNFVERYFHGSLFNFLITFSRDADLSAEEIENLKKWVNDLDENNK